MVSLTSLVSGRTSIATTTCMPDSRRPRTDSERLVCDAFSSLKAPRTVHGFGDILGAAAAPADAVSMEPTELMHGLITSLKSREMLLADDGPAAAEPAANGTDPSALVHGLISSLKSREMLVGWDESPELDHAPFGSPAFDSPVLSLDIDAARLDSAALYVDGDAETAALVDGLLESLESLDVLAASPALSTGCIAMLSRNQSPVFEDDSEALLSSDSNFDLAHHAVMMGGLGSLYQDVGDEEVAFETDLLRLPQHAADIDDKRREGNVDLSMREARLRQVLHSRKHARTVVSPVAPQISSSAASSASSAPIQILRTAHTSSRRRNDKSKKPAASFDLYDASEDKENIPPTRLALPSRSSRAARAHRSPRRRPAATPGASSGIPLSCSWHAFSDLGAYPGRDVFGPGAVAFPPREAPAPFRHAAFASSASAPCLSAFGAL